MANSINGFFLLIIIKVFACIHIEGKRIHAENSIKPLSFEDKANLKGFVDTWDNAVIPYEIDSSIENLPRTIDAIRSAMKHWEKKTCIRFVKWSNETYFLKFFRGSHCYGRVGRYVQSVISVGEHCDYENIMLHEIGHVVGMFHEQRRKDRDNWIKIHWENIPPLERVLYTKVENKARLQFPYDYASIMHYPFSIKSNRPIMTSLRDTHGKEPYISLSQTDVAYTSIMYNCSKIQKQRRIQKKVIRKTDKQKNFDKTACVDEVSSCDRWAKKGICDRYYVLKQCPRSCNSPVCEGSDCKDNYQNCERWGKQGYCKTIESVQTECQLTCNPTCQSNRCVDQRPYCHKWFMQGRCSNDEAVRFLCPKSCRVALCLDVKALLQERKKRDDTEKKKTQILFGSGMLCHDNKKDCPEMAWQGFCIRSPKWMSRFCLKSCPSTHCDQTIPKPKGSCNEPLGLSLASSKNESLPNRAFHASSELNSGGWIASASSGRLYYEDDHKSLRIGAWCAAYSGKSYLQVDLLKVKTVVYIATQGRSKSYERVSRYKIQFSLDGQKFESYKENSVIKNFEGNYDHITPVLNEFEHPFRARFVRIIPVLWNYPCLRMELFGCS